MATTGPYGGITWSSAFPGMASIEAANEATAADPEWIPFVDPTTAGGVFTTDPMATTQAMYRRIH